MTTTVGRRKEWEEGGRNFWKYVFLKQPGSQNSAKPISIKTPNYLCVYLTHVSSVTRWAFLRYVTGDWVKLVYFPSFCEDLSCDLWVATLCVAIYYIHSLGSRKTAKKQNPGKEQRRGSCVWGKCFVVQLEVSWYLVFTKWWHLNMQYIKLYISLNS